MSISAAEASALYLRSRYPPEGAVLKREEARHLEDQGHHPWLNAVFPDLFDCEFLPEHEQFWEWGFKFLIALRDRKPLPQDANAFLDLLSRNFGKCLARDTKILMADGTVKPIQEIAVGDVVMSVDQVTGRSVHDRVTQMWESGVKPCYMLRTRMNKSLTLTGEHRLWTLDGWKTLAELRVGDRVAIPRRTRITSIECAKSDAEVRFLAYMLAEGGTGKRHHSKTGATLLTCSAAFTNADQVIVDDFRRSAAELGIGVRFKGRYGYSLSNAQNTLRAMGLAGKLSHEKFLPQWVFRLPERQRWLFLAAFIDTDGYVTPVQTGIALASEQMILDLQYLFLSVGVPSKVHYKANKCRGAWVLTIDREAVKLCALKLPLLLKAEKMSRCVGRARSLYDVYPAWVGRCMGVPKGSWQKLHNPHYDISRKKLRRLMREMKSPLWEWLEDADVMWDRIDSIEPAGEVETFDLETKTYHNFIANGIVSHNSMHCETFMAAAVCIVGYGIFLYVSGSQDLANEHLANITGLLQSDGVTTWYPEHSRPKKSQITGANRGWTQKKIMTEGGATVWAIGLLVGVRGIRQGKERVRGFVLDDVDDYDDSPAIALKKANTLASSVLPTSDVSFFVIGAQNLITEHSVFHRIYTKQDMMLAHRIVCGPLKAFENLDTEFRDGRDMIIGGESNWPERVTYDVGQRFIDTYGLIRFLAEFQHDFSSSKQGLCLENYDDQVHVITRSEFFSMIGSREVPNRWYKYQAHDHARTKTVFHANVTMTLAVSSMNERFPGFFFIDHPMSFPAQTEADEVALRFLKSVSPTVQINGQNRLWDELVTDSLKRTNIDSYSHDLTKLMRLRRAALAKIIPPAVGPLLSQRNYKYFRMSHEQINAAGKVYRDVYGIPASACNPGADGGLELFNHFLAVDYNSMHPCAEPSAERVELVMRKNECSFDEALERIKSGTGPGGRGFTRTLVIVEDGQLEYTADVSPERLHDAGLLRHQWQHWRYTKPTLNDKGEKEWGPQKMNDDFGNCAMFLFHDTVPQAAPLNHGELVQEYMPVPLKDETIEAEVDPERAVKLKMAQLMKLKGIEKQLQKRPSRNLVGRYRDLMKRK